MAARRIRRECGDAAAKQLLLDARAALVAASGQEGAAGLFTLGRMNRQGAAVALFDKIAAVVRRIDAIVPPATPRTQQCGDCGSQNIESRYEGIYTGNGDDPEVIPAYCRECASRKIILVATPR